jgi:adenosylcobinamide-GDP ribazoletransferase
MLRAMITAFRTLTIIPIPGKDTEDFSRSLCFFPLVGALLGFVVLILYHSAGAIGFKHSFILALLSMAIVTRLTGGLHIDGLGDVADAFGGGKNKEHILQLLKDPAMGSFGVCAIVFDILIKAWCWEFFLEKGNPWFILWSFVFSRSMQGVAIAFIPNARAESIAAPFGQGGKSARQQHGFCPLRLPCSVLCALLQPPCSSGFTAGESFKGLRATAWERRMNWWKSVCCSEE